MKARSDRSRLVIERMHRKDWDRVRKIRARALCDTPDAFGTTIEEHEDQSIALWQNRLAASDAATFLAIHDLHDFQDAGMVTGTTYADQPEACGLFGMWVDPEARGEGLGRLLVEAVADWARSKDYGRVILDVADENLPAIRLYARCGFERTGRTGTLPAPRTHIREHERALTL